MSVHWKENKRNSERKVNTVVKPVMFGLKRSLIDEVGVSKEVSRDRSHRERFVDKGNSYILN